MTMHQIKATWAGKDWVRECLTDPPVHGGSACPICGVNGAHGHSVADETFRPRIDGARAHFERVAPKLLRPFLDDGEKRAWFKRASGDHDGDYLNETVNACYIAWLAAWMTCKGEQS